MWSAARQSRWVKGMHGILPGFRLWEAGTLPLFGGIFGGHLL